LIQLAIQKQGAFAGVKFLSFRSIFDADASDYRGGQVPFSLAFRIGVKWLAERGYEGFKADYYGGGKGSLYAYISPPLDWMDRNLEAIARLCEAEANSKTLATPPHAVSAEEDPDQMVSPESIAKWEGLDNRQKYRLRKKLKAWRGPTNTTEWTEVQDRKPRQAAYLYRLGSIRHLIDAVKPVE